PTVGREPSRGKALMCTNRSPASPLGVMNPKPRSSFQDLSFPLTRIASVRTSARHGQSGAPRGTSLEKSNAWIVAEETTESSSCPCQLGLAMRNLNGSRRRRRLGRLTFVASGRLLPAGQHYSAKHERRADRMVDGELLAEEHDREHPAENRQQMDEHASA